MKYLSLFLLLIGLNACTVDSRFVSGELSESTVTNGGNPQSGRLARVFDSHVKRGLLRESNTELIRQHLSEAELKELMAFFDRGISVAVVIPDFLTDGRFLEPSKKRLALVKNGDLLDSRQEAVSARVVWDELLKGYVIQVDENYLRQFLTPDDQPSPALLRLLSHELFRLAYFTKGIRFADENYELSKKLYFPPALKKPVDQITITGNRRSTIDNEGFSFGHPWKNVAGATYEGVVNCFEAKIENWILPEIKMPPPGLCFLRVTFNRNEGSVIRGKMKYSLFSYPQMTSIQEDTFSYFEDERDILVEPHRTQEMVGGELMVFGDMLSIGTISTLFRVDKSAPPVSGKTFTGEHFIELPAYDLACNLNDFMFETACDLHQDIVKLVSLKFLNDGTFEYVGPHLDSKELIQHEARRTGTYQQVGNNILLTFEESHPEMDLSPNVMSLWLRPAREALELVTISGESLYAKPPPRQPLARRYRASINCKETFYVPFPEQLKEEWKLGIGEACSVTLEFHENGTGIINHRMQYPSRGIWKKATGKIVRGGRHVGIWDTTQNKFISIYKLLPNGELADSFGNIFEVIR